MARWRTWRKAFCSPTWANGEEFRLGSTVGAQRRLRGGGMSSGRLPGPMKIPIPIAETRRGKTASALGISTDFNGALRAAGSGVRITRL